MIREENIILKPVTVETLEQDNGNRLAIVINNAAYRDKTGPDGAMPIHPELYAMVQHHPGRPPALTRIHKMVDPNRMFELVYLEDYVAGIDPDYNVLHDIACIGTVNAFDGGVLGQTRAISQTATFPPGVTMDERRYVTVLSAAQAEVQAQAYRQSPVEQKAQRLALFKDNLRREVVADKHGPTAPGI